MHQLDPDYVPVCIYCDLRLVDYEPDPDACGECRKELLEEILEEILEETGYYEY